MSQILFGKYCSCPIITFQQQTRDEYGDSTSYTHNHAKTIVPNNLGDLNLVHGVVKITEGLAALDR